MHDVFPDLTEPAFWHRPDVHEAIAALRARGNVHRHPTADEGPICSVLDYATAMVVLGNHTAFSNEGGALLGTRGRTPLGVGKMMALTDPPCHHELRAPAIPFFSAQRVASLEPYIRAIVVGLVERAIAQREVEFIRGVASPLPAAVMCDLFGVPASDRETVVQMCDDAFLGASPQHRSIGHQRLLAYLFDLVEARREQPGQDVLSALATCTIGGARLKAQDVVLNCDNILVGGIQTVRHTAALGVLALTTHPDAWETLRASDCDLDVAVEEVLRWTSAGVNAVRTTSRACEANGVPFEPGERVVIWLPAVNRDPAVFAEPNRFDLRRAPNHHLTFGRGPHYCIGAPLARLELRVLFEELRRHVRQLELVAPPRPTDSIIDLGLESLHLHLVAA
jgi:cytochrome P450